MTNRLDCRFCQIVLGTHPSKIVLEEENLLAFLDIRPLIIGHCLLIPKPHIVTITDLPEKLMPDMLKASQKIVKALEKGLHAEGTFVAMNNRISQSVPHLHFHIVPRYTKDGLKGFFWPRHKYSNEEHMKETQLKIMTAIQQVD